MATDAFVRVPPDGVGKKLYTRQHTVGPDTVQGQVMHVADPNNASHIQQVDVRGQAYTRFAEGSPSLTAFGELRVGEGKMMGAYEYTHGDMADLCTDTVANGGAITYNSATSMVTLSVSGANGATAERETNRYHYYQPGVGMFIVMTLAHGDTGKAGNVREWGYSNHIDGLMWRLNGTTLEVVRRTSTEGSPYTEYAVDRTNWNGDKLDGTGPSGMVLDITKANFYWIDFAWLGVGPVRFGIIAPDGSRWVCHTFQNPNNNVGPYMATGSLPLHWHNYNTSATAGTSEMNTICAAVYAESKTDFTYWRFGVDSGVPKSVGSSDTPMITLRPQLEYQGKTNRVGLYPDSISFYVSGGPVQIKLIDDATLTGASFVAHDETAEYDISATSLTGGSVFRTGYVAAGTSTFPVDYFYETNDEGYHVLADGSGQYSLTVAMKKLNPGDTVTACVSINYRELR